MKRNLKAICSLILAIAMVVPTVLQIIPVQAVGTAADETSCTHQFTHYTSNGDATAVYVGSETATCDICHEATDTRDVRTVLDVLDSMNAECNHFAYEFDLTEFVKHDADLNNAITIPTSNSGPAEIVIKTADIGNETIKNDVKGKIRLDLDGDFNIFSMTNQRIIDGQYHLYVKKDVELNKESYSNIMFSYWSPKSSAVSQGVAKDLISQIYNSEDKKADFYLSMKVVMNGEYPEYYINRIVMVDSSAVQ